MKESVGLKGNLTLTLQKSNGDIQQVRKDNIIVNGGFDFICDALAASSNRPAVMGYIGLGTGTAAPAATNVALGTQLLRKAATYAHTVGTKVFTLSAAFAAGEATGAITEAGVFNAASNGTMLDRVTFSVINKGADDTLTAQFQFTLS